MKKTYAKQAVKDIGRINNPAKQRIRNGINELPLGDDVATPELIARHKIAMDEFHRGETVDHDDIDWE